jgi:hypothetical protein
VIAIGQHPQIPVEESIARIEAITNSARYPYHAHHNEMRIRTMGRDGRRIINLPKSEFDLRGQQRDAAVKSEALVLADALIGALDLWDLFQHQGGIVLVANGELQTVNAENLRWILAETFAEKRVVRKLSRYEVEYRPLNPNEMAVRALLRADPRDGGLITRLPPLNVEQPQAPVAPPEPRLPDDHPETIASRRTQARYTNADARRELESARGREVSERYARQQQQAATETQVAEPQVVESYSVFAPPEETPPPAENE